LHSDLYKDIQSVPGPEKMQLDLIPLMLIVVKFPWITHNWRCIDYFLSYMSPGYKKTDALDVLSFLNGFIAKNEFWCNNTKIFQYISGYSIRKRFFKRIQHDFTI